MLMTNEQDYKANTWNLPPAEDIASALNNLKADEANYKVFSQAAAGSIAGITRVLSGFWTDETTGFPSPSMYGSGDRVSICWAVFGRYPDITSGVAAKTTGELYHACQGLELSGTRGDTCAQVEVFHSCRGSNTCKAEGGCGFVQVQGQSALCGHKVLLDHLQPTRPLQGQVQARGSLQRPRTTSVASFWRLRRPPLGLQLYPIPDSTHPDEKVGWMDLFDFVGQTAQPEPIKKGMQTVLQRFEVGERVYDIAWQAYIKVLEHRKQPIPDKPKDSELRLAFPPST